MGLEITYVNMRKTYSKYHNWETQGKDHLQKAIRSSEGEDALSKLRQGRRDLSRLHGERTVSSRLKQRVSDDVATLWNDVDSGDDDGNGETDDDEEDIFDPTYELAASRRSGQAAETSKAFVQNSRNNFRTEVSD